MPTRSSKETNMSNPTNKRIGTITVALVASVLIGLFMLAQDSAALSPCQASIGYYWDDTSQTCVEQLGNECQASGPTYEQCIKAHNNIISSTITMIALVGATIGVIVLMLLTLRYIKRKAQPPTK